MESTDDDRGRPHQPLLYDTCKICAALWDAFAGTSCWVLLPPLNVILGSFCPSHDPLFRYIEGLWPGSAKHKPVTISKSSADHPLMIGDASSGDDRASWRYIVVKSDDSISWPLDGRIIDRHWIDTNLIKRWIEKCDTIHGNACTNPLRIGRVSPDWLIDALKACIICGHGITEYVALSYRWGVTESFRTGRDGIDFAMIQEPGALEEISIIDKIPLSILHAMWLVKSIGERYLWVDALCVNQSDKEHLGRQLELMGAIYASAKFTIVASDGDATHGIKGLRNISPSRNLEFAVTPCFENAKIIQTHTEFQGTDSYGVSQFEDQSHYFQRGWTYQEFFLSKKRLIFNRERVYWQCTCEEWYEDIIEQAPTSRSTRSSSGKLASLLSEVAPPFKALSDIVTEYSKRKFTYAEDFLPGILGTFSILTKSYEGGFLCGLPEAYFDAALLWSGPWPMCRRENSGGNHSTLQSALPSWSWIGWQANYVFMAEGQTLSLEEVDNKSACKTTPITQWFTHEFPNSDSKKRLIQPAWFNFRKDFNNSASSLPPGWAKKRANSKCNMGLDDRYIYYLTESPNVEYWLPFPVPAVREEVTPWSPPQTPFISCRTKRGWFTCTQSDKQYDHRSGMDIKEYSNENSGHCGNLYLHAEPEWDAIDGSFVVELAAICLQLKYIHYHNPPGWYEVYGVLYVQWLDGVAFRKGWGFVYKEMWEACNLEDVDLVLG
ncbi:heterokaryon incompatibility protein-domain-containing protein [Nemania sp. FL0916]|nr:heterokaryon incompatibility protein-domain-containing protein [Nemania sp. FL0916]